MEICFQVGERVNTPVGQGTFLGVVETNGVAVRAVVQLAAWEMMPSDAFYRGYMELSSFGISEIRKVEVEK